MKPARNGNSGPSRPIIEPAYVREGGVNELAWWQRGVVYEIYPRSFKDANGDGIGDLQGIIDKLDYLAWLGVDALWLTPVFPSPMVDFGYDVSDYTDIDPVFGDLATMDALVGKAHDLGLRIVLDFVANHTSDRHPWFLGSRSSRCNREAGLVHLARRSGGRRSPQQLDVGVRRQRLGVGRGDRPVLLPCLRQAAARPELAQP